MVDDNHSLMNALIKTDQVLKKRRGDFSTAMQKMGLSSVFDIVRLPKSAFARQLARFSDANAELAYDNAMGYAALIARLYREHKTSSGGFQALGQRSGVRALVPAGPSFPNLFEENWDEFCKVGAIAAIDSPVAYLSALRVFIQQLEATGSADIAPQRVLIDKRRPDLKSLLITQESTFTPRPMLEIVNDVLGSNLRNYLENIPADRNKPTHQVLTERRYPFQLPYNFYHHQCQLGLADKKPRLGELNYRASLLLPIEQKATNRYGVVQQPTLQAQRLLSGLSPQQQALLIEPSVFSNFYLNRNDLINGWRSAGNTFLHPHSLLSECFLLPEGQEGIGVAVPQANAPVTGATGTNKVSVTFTEHGTPTHNASVELSLASATPGNITGRWLLNSKHNAGARIITSFIQASGALPDPTNTGLTAHFNLLVCDGAAPAKSLARQRVTVTLDDSYNLTAAEQAFFKQSYGVVVTDNSPLWQITRLTDFMQHTGLNAEQVEMLLCRRTHAVRLSANCPSSNPQHAGVPIADDAMVLPFPHPNHYGACYINGTGTGGDLYDGQHPPSPESIIRDQFDNAMDLEQGTPGSTKQWHLTKTSLDRLDRLQRMVRLQRWCQIPFAQLDTLILSAMRAEGESNLGMELNENTLRALGVYRHLNQRYGIAPEEFAALMHNLTPYASGKDELPLFDQVFNRVQLFDTPLILDQTAISLTATDAATQKTLLQWCAGLGLQPTEDSLLLIAKRTQTHVGALKRDLATVSSLYRQARIARLFNYTVDELLTLALLLGGHNYQSLLASGRLSPVADKPTPDILDVLMQLDWAVEWLKDSQQTVAQLQQRLGPYIPVLAEAPDGGPQVTAAAAAPPSDDLLNRLAILHDDTIRNCVTAQEVALLGLPLYDDLPASAGALEWFALLIGHKLLNASGLLMELDRPLSPADEPTTWPVAEIDKLVDPLRLKEPVKVICKAKLVELLLKAQVRQTQLLESLFQDTAKLAPERCVAVLSWANTSVYSLLIDALKQPPASDLIEQFLNVSCHAEIAVHLRLSDSALRLFLVNREWLSGDEYEITNSQPSLSDLYLFERFSHWFHNQSQSEDSVLSYFSMANPAPAKLKNKALRDTVNDAANGALARLLGWSATEVTALTDTLPAKRATSMVHVDWVRRCQASCVASGLSAKALLQATQLHAASSLDNWKAVGEAVMAASHAADSTLANG
ncbi:Tc toxin subunit A [Pseudomonas sp.]|uniref:Tc toxin subunit A n=1 Tax=Pseudomonas sp. TaxID=306 RepID=UPI003BB6F81B